RGGSEAGDDDSLSDEVGDAVGEAVPISPVRREHGLVAVDEDADVAVPGGGRPLDLRRVAADFDAGLEVPDGRRCPDPGRDPADVNAFEPVLGNGRGGDGRQVAEDAE